MGIALSATQEGPAMKNQRIGLVAAAVLSVLAVPTARAIDVNAGKWTLSFDGNVNANYIYSDCQKASDAHVVDGGLACVATNSSSSAVSNGLLPAALTVSGATTQDGWDLGFTFGLYPGISTNDGGSPNLQASDPAGFGHTALGTAGLDIRQVFLTVGNKEFGTIMAGRNIGLFGADAILNDMTLLGVGAGNGNYAAPANTSLGSIGLGYIYTDWLSQIDYTTPDMAGAKVTVGIFDPLNTLGQMPENHSSPGFQGKIAYTLGSLYLSASGLYQKQRIGCTDVAVDLNPCFASPAASFNDVQYSSTAFDFGGKYDINGFEVMGWYYTGNGVGTTGLYVLSQDEAGNPRHSDGFIAQVTYTMGPTKIGFNYGQSNLDRNAIDTGELVAKNDKWTAGIYHNLTENLLLVGEFSRIQDQNSLSQKNTSWNLNLGLFLKF
jgi:predicted porin